MVSPCKWGRLCANCGSTNTIQRFGPGFSQFDLDNCQTCHSCPPAQASMVGGDLWLMDDAAKLLTKGLQTLPQLGWWHTTRALGGNFDPHKIDHVGTMASAQHRALSTEALEAGEQWVMPQELRHVKLVENVRIREVVHVEASHKPAVHSIREKDGPPEPLEAVAYVNRMEDPGSLSLWLGRDCVKSTRLMGAIKGVRLSCRRSRRPVSVPERSPGFGVPAGHTVAPSWCSSCP